MRIIRDWATGPFLSSPLGAAAVAALLAVTIGAPLLGLSLPDRISAGTYSIEPLRIIAFAGIVFGLKAVFVRLAGVSVGRAARDGLGRIATGSRIGVAMAVAAILLPLFVGSDRYAIQIATTITIYVLLGWGLNIVVGLAGLLDLGYVAFYAVGAYTFALASTFLGLGFWQVLPIAGLLAAFLGVALGLPVLRLRGDYLAIVTVGLGEIVRLVLINADAVTGGPSGIANIPKMSLGPVSLLRTPPPGARSAFELLGLTYSPIYQGMLEYYVALAFALALCLVTIRLRRMPLGRSFEALREDEVACRSLGINPVNVKLAAFGTGAFFAGLAGCIFASTQGFVSPESFTFVESALILAIVVLGGRGSLHGVAIAAIVLVGTPEVARSFGEYRMVLFGAAMVAMICLKPSGFVGLRSPSVVATRR